MTLALVSGVVPPGLDNTVASSQAGQSIMLLSEYAIFCQEVLDGLLLTAMDPAGKDQEQELPWRQRCFHIPPNVR